MAKTELTLEAVAELIQSSEKRLRKDMVTKKDLKQTVKREDIKQLPTRKDLEQFAAKDDLADNNIEIIDAVENYLSRYPTKDEFYESQDTVVGEIRDLREEVTVHNGVVQENRERITKLEQTVFKN